MIPRAFGASPAWSVGVEEELFVLDAATLEPAPFPPELFDGERVKAELFTTLVELTTPVCRSVVEAAEELAAGRERARRHAASAGLALAAAGTWPSAVPEAQPVTDAEPLLAFVDYAGPSARRQYCAGFHVHVGVASAEACMAALEAVLPWLPLLLAVSANSPYLAGEESGLASTRAEILALLPRSGAPPAYRDYEEWERFVERLVALGLADTTTRVWWDARPHPRLGTLEVRMPDQPTGLAASAAFAALVQALVATADRGRSADRGVYQQNRWAALRFGPAAELVHPFEDRLVPAAELLAELLERVAPAARRLGSADLLAPLERLDQAALQLDVGRRDGLASLGRRLVTLT